MQICVCFLHPNQLIFHSFTLPDYWSNCEVLKLIWLYDIFWICCDSCAIWQDTHREYRYCRSAREWSKLQMSFGSQEISFLLGKPAGLAVSSAVENMISCWAYASWFSVLVVGPPEACYETLHFLVWYLDVDIWASETGLPHLEIVICLCFLSASCQEHKSE